MHILNSIPLVGIVLGIFILLVIFPDRKNFVQNKLAKTFLVSIVVLNFVSQLDLFLYYNNDVQSDLSGITHIFNHLYGFLSFLYISALLKRGSPFKRWLIIAGIYTLLRAVILIFSVIYIDLYLDPNEVSFPVIVIWVDAYLSLLLNIFFLIISYSALQKVHFIVKLTPESETNVTWFKRLILISGMAYIAIVLYGIYADFQEIPLMSQAKIESLIINILFFITAFFAIKFPSFSVDGDSYEDSSAEAIKYSKSSLREDDSDQIWDTINKLMQQEKIYRNPEYRLNDLAETCNKSVHHISQVVNKNSGTSFSDFINKYRIEEAKVHLLTEKAQQLTIIAIAYEVGFNSKTSFYSAFKKECGMTPSVYKDSHRLNPPKDS